MPNIDDLGTLAAEVAMRSAAEYVRVNNLRVHDYDAAAECIRAHCKARLSDALRDAKEALDCGMMQVAQATFKATMALAGIEAAKEFTRPAVEKSE